MWSRKRLDIGWGDLLFGVLRVCLPPDRATAAAGIERLWPDPEHTLACFSVRTGFDLLLGALSLPRGSEVLVSAITIPDMARIIEDHDCVPVPVDLDPATMAPTIGQWTQAITARTRILLVAHLFGGRCDLAPVVELARRHGLLLIEDCAQAFVGTTWSGHPTADVSMFSFGTIKARTALGGAVLRVRDSGLLTRMRASQAAYPVQHGRSYLKRLVKCSLLKALSYRVICRLVLLACRAAGVDYDRRINGAARGFPGDELLFQIRRQPSAPLLAMLGRRLQRYDQERWQRQADRRETLATMLDDSAVCPGAAVGTHNYWVFPVAVKEPVALIERLAANGFDATQGHSLCVVQPPDRTWQQAHNAEAILRRLVFLPFYPEMPERELNRMAAIIDSLSTRNSHKGFAVAQRW